MRLLNYLLRKEFKQIFRNKALLPLLFAMPVIQLLIMPLAADYEFKNINIAIVDKDHSSLSHDLISKIKGSGYFILSSFDNSYEQAYKSIENNTADLILEIPANFEKEITRAQKQELFIAVNAINGVKANIGSVYLATIIKNFNQGLILKESIVKQQRPKQIRLETTHWYNPLLNYNFFMVPGILVVLVTLIASYSCALNIVKEKELGTIEQLNVTPIKKHIFILGKLLPFLIIGVADFTIGLFVVAWLVYGIFPLGSIFALYIYLIVYLVCVLGMGLLISTYSQTQQQAMSITFFFLVIFLMMSGLFTPIESMPKWSKVIAYCNPVTYFIEVIRMIILKGSTLVNILPQIGITLLFAAIFNIWAIVNYKKTV